jgi:hypothetical protein
METKRDASATILTDGKPPVAQRIVAAAGR